MAKKSRVVVDTEESKLNMTPMIDMTFLLVVFFMVTIDLTQKEFEPVDLPYAYEGSEDEHDDSEVPRFIINLLPGGKIKFKGQEFNLSSENPQAQNTALKALHDQLAALAVNPRYREEDGSSKIPVMIHGDRTAKWQYVQWIMMVCAKPKIQIYQIQFGVKKPETEE